MGELTAASPVIRAAVLSTCSPRWVTASSNVSWMLTMGERTFGRVAHWVSPRGSSSHSYSSGS